MVVVMGQTLQNDKIRHALSCVTSTRHLIHWLFLHYRFPAVCHYTRDRVSMFYCNDIFPYITPCVYAFGLIAQTGSIYCTLGVTVERYIVICWPFRLV